MDRKVDETVAYAAENAQEVMNGWREPYGLLGSEV